MTESDSSKTSPAVESLRQEQEAQKRTAREHKKDGTLDDALKDTFPASDPVAVQSATKPGSAEAGEKKSRE